MLKQPPKLELRYGLLTAGHESIFRTASSSDVVLSIATEFVSRRESNRVFVINWLTLCGLAFISIRNDEERQSNSEKPEKWTACVVGTSEVSGWDWRTAETDLAKRRKCGLNFLGL
jgi:hypothetical protein